MQVLSVLIAKESVAAIWAVVLCVFLYARQCLWTVRRGNEKSISISQWETADVLVVARDALT